MDGMITKLGFCLFAGMLALSLNTVCGAEKSAGTGRQPEKSDSLARVGIYDSRAIAVAYAGSDFHIRWAKSLKAESERAKTEGNQKLYAELKAKAADQQKLLHMQGFSVAPVDNILANIKDKIPEIIRNAGVAAIESKWDKEALRKYKPAEFIDITMELVKAFNPNDRQLKWAVEIQKKEPVSLEQAKKIKD
jgi:hypothetical protein